MADMIRRRFSGNNHNQSNGNGNGSKRPPGRPSKYDPSRLNFADLAYRLTLLRFDDEQLAMAFDVNLATISNWKNDRPEFLDAIKRGKADADGNVIRSLYERAVGYSHPDTHISTFKDKATGQVVVLTTPITKHYPPDPVACIFWLKNRQRLLWRDVHKMEHSGPDGKPIEQKIQMAPLDLSKLTDEELAMAESVGLKLTESGSLPGNGHNGGKGCS